MVDEAPQHLGCHLASLLVPVRGAGAESAAMAGWPKTIIQPCSQNVPSNKPDFFERHKIPEKRLSPIKVKCRVDIAHDPHQQPEGPLWPSSGWVGLGYTRKKTTSGGIINAVAKYGNAAKRGGRKRETELGPCSFDVGSYFFLRIKTVLLD